MSELQPTSWRCPSCKTMHSRPHWQDQHQEIAGWKDKLAPHDSCGDKGSNPDFQQVCESCGGKLEKKNSVNWCKSCNEPKEGIPASPFCPHCGWSAERIVLVKT